MRYKTVKILEAGKWRVYANIPEKHVDLYVRYVLSRGYTRAQVMVV